MTQTLHYRGYSGSVQFSPEDALLHGRLLGIRDLVSYEGISMRSLETNFQEAIDDYLLFCQQQGKKPDIPSSKAVEGTVGNSEEIEMPSSGGRRARDIEEVRVGEQVTDASEAMRDTVQHTEMEWTRVKLSSR